MLLQQHLINFFSLWSFQNLSVYVNYYVAHDQHFPIISLREFNSPMWSYEQYSNSIFRNLVWMSWWYWLTRSHAPRVEYWSSDVSWTFQSVCNSVNYTFYDNKSRHRHIDDETGRRPTTYRNLKRLCYPQWPKLIRFEAGVELFWQDD